MQRQKPSHDLEKAKQLAREGKFHVRGRALRFLMNRYGNIGIDDVIVSVICSIQPEDYLKTDEMKMEPGVLADIYRNVSCANYPEEKWYVKFFITADTVELSVWSMNWDGYIH